MKVEFIAIGDELLNGRTADKNAFWLARKLNDLGLILTKVSFINDNLPLIIRAMEKAMERADLVITSGGIGPTKDDLTKLALAGFLKTQIIENETAAQIAINNYERFGRSWAPELNDYHKIPQGSAPISNPKGLAPGLTVEQKGKWIFLTPGVPREFYAMVEREILPFLHERFSQEFKQLQKIQIRTREVPEEKIFGEISPTLWQQLEPFGQLSSLPYPLGIDIVIRFEGNQTNRAEKLQQIKQLSAIKPLLPWIWQWGDLTPAEYIIQKATEKKLTIATAESCSGGQIASLLTDVPGSSECFLGGVVSYHNKVKINQLGVAPKTLEQYGAVSEQTALEMAQGVKNLIGSDLAISTSGIAGPAGATSENPVGTITIGACSNEKNYSYKTQYPGDRQVLKERFAMKGLFTLIDLLTDSNI